MPAAPNAPRSDRYAAAATDPSLPLVECRGVVKQYPGVLALDRVDFQLRSGEVHVLFGENGAGKSTLISLLAGAQGPRQARSWCVARQSSLPPSARARGLGISAVFSGILAGAAAHCRRQRGSS
jgi:ribose transport system ATP-binding protein